MPIYHLIEAATGRVNDVGASNPTQYGDRDLNVYTITEGVCPKSTEWTGYGPASLGLRIRVMVDRYLETAPEITNTLYKQFQVIIRDVYAARTAKDLEIAAEDLRGAKTAVTGTLVDLLEQAAVECERDIETRFS